MLVSTNTIAPGMGGVRIYDINEKAFSLMLGDKILLTTDGLTNILENHEILTLLGQKQLSESLDMLFEKTAQRSCGIQDNTTCILITMKDGESQHD